MIHVSSFVQRKYYRMQGQMANTFSEQSLIMISFLILRHTVRLRTRADRRLPEAVSWSDCYPTTYYQHKYIDSDDEVSYCIFLDPPVITTVALFIKEWYDTLWNQKNMTIIAIICKASHADHRQVDHAFSCNTEIAVGWLSYTDDLLMIHNMLAQQRSACINNACIKLRTAQSATAQIVCKDRWLVQLSEQSFMMISFIIESRLTMTEGMRAHRRLPEAVSWFDCYSSTYNQYKYTLIQTMKSHTAYLDPRVFSTSHYL
jgi:hypothetical protein